MLPKDNRTDNKQVQASTMASAESGNSDLARSVMDRYADTTTHGRSGAFPRPESYPRLTGEKSLSFAEDLMRRWKSGGGAATATGRSLPLLSRVFRLRAESDFDEHGVSEMKHTRQTEARSVFLHGADAPVTGTGKPGGESLLRRSLTAHHTTADIYRKQGSGSSGSNRNGVAGQLPGPDRQKTADVTSLGVPVSRSESGTAGEIIPNGNSNVPDHLLKQPSAVDLPRTEQEISNMGQDIMERHNRPTLVRLYRQASDDFPSLQERAALSGTIAASRSPLSHGNSAERRETAVNGDDANLRFLRNYSPAPGKRLSRQIVEIGNSVADLASTLPASKGPTAGKTGPVIAKPGQETGESVVIQVGAGHYSRGSDIGYFPERQIPGQALGRPAVKTATAKLSLVQRIMNVGSNESGGSRETAAECPVSTLPLPSGSITPLRNSFTLRKMQTAPIVSRFQGLSAGGLRPVLMRMKAPSAETLYTDVGDLRFSVRQNETQASRRTGEGSTSYFAVEADASAQRLSRANAPLPEAGHVGTSPNLAEKLFATTSAPVSLMTKKASSSLSNPANNSGGIATGFIPEGFNGKFESQTATSPIASESAGVSLIFRRLEGCGSSPNDRFEPFFTQVTGDMPVAWSRGSGASLYRSINQFTETSVLSEFPSQAIVKQGKSNFTENKSGSAHGAAASFTELPFPASFTGPARLSPSRDLMPLVKRKASAGPEPGGTGNCGTIDRYSRQHDLSGFLQRSAERNSGGSDSTAIPAATSIPSASVPPAGPAAGGINSPAFDLERIADEVYLIIERRLIAEKERKGL